MTDNMSRAARGEFNVGGEGGYDPGGPLPARSRVSMTDSGESDRLRAQIAELKHKCADYVINLEDALIARDEAVNELEILTDEEPSDYRDRVLDALRPQLPDFSGIGVGFIAGVVLAVRDAEMEQLRAETKRLDTGWAAANLTAACSRGERDLARAEAKSHSNSWAHCDERRQELYQENERLRAELAGLRERAVILPEVTSKAAQSRNASGGPTVWLLDGGPGSVSRYYRETNGLLETREPSSEIPWRLSLYSSLAEVRREVGPLTEVTEHQYLGETCEHHWRNYDELVETPAHRQCLWCAQVQWLDGGDYV